MELSGYLQRHLARKGAGMAPTDKLALAQALQRFLEYFGDYPIAAITDAALTRFAMWVRGNYSAPTARMTVEAAEGALAAYRSEAELSTEEVDRLISSAEDAELKGLIILLARYGLPLTDALSLHTVNVGKKDRSLVYRCSKTREFVLASLAGEDAACLRKLARGGKGKPLFTQTESAFQAKLHGHATLLGFAGKLKGFTSLRRYYRRVVLRERRKKEGGHES